MMITRDCLLIIAVGVLSVASCAGQDTLQVNSDSVRLKLENSRVRVLESRLQPGGKEKMHSHPAYIVYVIKAVRFVFTSPTARRWKPSSKRVMSSIANQSLTGVRTSEQPRYTRS